MSPLDPLNEIGYMPPPSNLEDQIQLTPTIFGAPKKDRFFHLSKLYNFLSYIPIFNFCFSANFYFSIFDIFYSFIQCILNIFT